jgi:plastocyanin
MRARINYLHFGAAAALALLTAHGTGTRTVRAIGISTEATNSGETLTDASAEATLSGVVKLEGPQPVATRINMAADPTCLKMHPAPVVSEEVVTGTNQALKNVIVYISNGLGNRTFDPPTEPVVFEQRGCTYNPHILGMRARQTLKVTNSDPTTHNIHPGPQNNREWNMSQPPGSSPIEETFAREEIIPVKCNVHPWMKGYIAVFKHPYFAITGKDGSFALRNIPPGDYTIQAWHEKYGVLSQKVNLAPDRSQEVQFIFKP